MPLKRLVSALGVSAIVLAVCLSFRVFDDPRSNDQWPALVVRVARGIEYGAVVVTFFLVCFVVAQGVHVLRTKRRGTK